MFCCRLLYSHRPARRQAGMERLLTEIRSRCRLQAGRRLAPSHAEKAAQQFREGKLDDRQVEIDVRERNSPSFEIISNQGVEEMDVNLKDMLPNIFGPADAQAEDEGVGRVLSIWCRKKRGRLIDMDQVTRLAVERASRARGSSS